MEKSFSWMAKDLIDGKSRTDAKELISKNQEKAAQPTLEMPAGSQRLNVSCQRNTPDDRTKGVLIIFMRLHEAEEKIQHCFETIGFKSTFAEFYQYVYDQLESSEATIKEISLYIPTFYRTVTGNRNQRYRATTVEHKWLQKQTDCLETAMAFYIAAKALRAKPLSNLLSEAIARCEAARKIHSDQVMAAQDAAQASRAARVKGGKIRHEKNEPARHEAARLLRAARPSTGWHSPLSAAKVICPALTVFIRANGLSIQVAEGLRRTVVRWIKNHPDVQFAYQGGLQTTL